MDKINIQYHTGKCYIKMREQDNYNEGCNLGTCKMEHISQTYKADSLSELLDLLAKRFKVEKDAFLLNSCEDVGRVDIQTMETAKGKKPSDNEMEQWKRGELDLYACTYTFYIEGSFTVDFTKSFAIENGYSTYYINEKECK